MMARSALTSKFLILQDERRTQKKEDNMNACVVISILEIIEQRGHLGEATRESIEKWIVRFNSILESGVGRFL
jgi:hypothetical protein